MKRIIQVVMVVMALLLFAGVVAAAPPAQDEGEGTVYVVKAGDGLILLAKKLLNSPDAYLRIIEATNRLAATDPSYQAITDPNIILVGQKLFIPGLAALPAAEEAPEAAAPATLPAVTAPAGAVTTLPALLLAGSSWVLTSLNNAPPLAETVVTLNFDETRAAGNSGCNTYSAAYEVTGFRISFGPTVGTLIACEQAIMDQEAAYLKALGEAAFFESRGGTLRLFDANTTMLAEFAPAQTALPGTAWDVLSYNNGKQAVVSLISGTSITAVFGEDGQLSGSAGCNNYFGPYTTDGSAIAIGPLASTRKFCAEEGVMDQEAAYLAALETADTYRVDGNRMELRTADGALVALMERQ